MSESSRAAHPVPAVIGVVLRGRDVLLVRRANPPDAGCWGFPGGKIEPGEPVADAAVREIAEETSVDVEALDVFTALDAFDRDADGTLRYHFVLVVVLCRWLRGTPVAGDDALDTRWFGVAELDRDDLPMSAGVRDVARRAVERAAALDGSPCES
ncbi:NUDIX hydrolase [Burkholderia pseudomultivorans]|jgi:mutator protein MutT|uniref:8-oxo-dGTP diphosphatase 2 n=1 Tax=Burkholderia pseudomultivorans TaxID=1207504 RepID=A0A6P2HIR7_9BURK|nr:NUDIX hydrolase [Burkholderia pseudomultivorans]MDR8730336.1 putative 8-oxo-dGTP diphosphatase 2 [Burkholderia pseudomultivorans]MDR8733827.1 putative 8-oxo-dGTP diphosphatase 2 [Burkholderia pseudomultivorans]MDR8743005.1 putative 8-oxo-dGTP diphosphatase 2 [Burkholderia pseudomultivorans]MDR8752321.1 putative 8-oxo-dGTP diphosphatase 2 [Burkholderia pseudomultivorans]MDR8778301.1 putative 8-oxo-dGTP diphosphatase 2 [Burkholderia pseudomultivorans]